MSTLKRPVIGSSVRKPHAMSSRGKDSRVVSSGREGRVWRATALFAVFFLMRDGSRPRLFPVDLEAYQASGLDVGGQVRGQKQSVCGSHVCEVE